LEKLSTHQLFDIKQKFLYEIPHPKLILKEVKKLEKYFHENCENLGPNLSLELPLLEYLIAHQDELLSLKFQIANSSEGHHLLCLLKELFRKQSFLIQKLNQYYSSMITLSGEQIKQSDPFKVHDIIKELRASDLSETQIKSYLCSSSEKKEDIALSYLEIAVIRANKICKNGG
jgi:hypothetical protein